MVSNELKKKENNDVKKDKNFKKLEEMKDVPVGQVKNLNIAMEMYKFKFF